MDSSSLAEAREESLFITLATYSPRDSCRDELHRFLKKVGGSELSKLPRLIISGVLEEAALIFGPKIMSFLKSSSSMCGEKPFVHSPPEAGFPGQPARSLAKRATEQPHLARSGEP